MLKVTPDRDRALSSLKMAKTSLEMIEPLDISRFPSPLLKHYYEIIVELETAIILLDGYKTVGEGAHKAMIDYLSSNYPEIGSSKLRLIDELRDLRNRISYEGFFVEPGYLQRKIKDIKKTVSKLVELLESKLTSHNL